MTITKADMARWVGRQVVIRRCYGCGEVVILGKDDRRVAMDDCFICCERCNEEALYWVQRIEEGW